MALPSTLCESGCLSRSPKYSGTATSGALTIGSEQIPTIAGFFWRLGVFGRLGILGRLGVFWRLGVFALPLPLARGGRLGVFGRLRILALPFPLARGGNYRRRR